MIRLKARIPEAVASSLRADAPQQLVGKAIRTEDWPELMGLSERADMILSPYMMFRKVVWRHPPGVTLAEVIFELVGVNCHRYYPLSREILTRGCETIPLAPDAHAAKLLRTGSPLRIARDQS